MTSAAETFTEKQAAARWNIGVTTLRTLRSRGLIGCIPMPKGYLFRDDHWTAFQAAVEVKPCHDAQGDRFSNSTAAGASIISTSTSTAADASLARARQMLAKPKPLLGSSSPNVTTLHPRDVEPRTE